MLGFKRFDYIVVTMAGIELAHQIKKQNSTSQLSVLLGHEPHGSRRPCWQPERQL